MQPPSTPEPPRLPDHSGRWRVALDHVWVGPAWFDVSTIQVRPDFQREDQEAYRRGYRSEPAAPFETMCFLLDLHGDDTGEEMYLQVYASRAAAAAGHQALVTQIRTVMEQATSLQEAITQDPVIATIAQRAGLRGVCAFCARDPVGVCLVCQSPVCKRHQFHETHWRHTVREVF